MSYRAEVITNAEGDWVSNRLRFATFNEARDYVRDLAKRWEMVTSTRVSVSGDPVNYVYAHGQLLAVVPLWEPTGELA